MTTSVLARTAGSGGLARTAAAVLLCCCAGLILGGCSGGSGSKTPSSGLTVPSVGRYAVPTSVDTALAREAFTPYAELGIVADDGLAPNESGVQFVLTCMTDAGYPNGVSYVPVGYRIVAGLVVGQAFGDWGYVGATDAAQYGFNLAGANSPAAEGPLSNTSDLPAAEQAAIGKCSTIYRNFGDSQMSSALAGINALGQTIAAHVAADPAVRQATRAWSACMKKDGYDFSDPNTLLNSERAFLSIGPSIPTPSAAQQSAQIATAEADAACSESSDLAGIFFAVQASYEQQVVSANTQQLNKAVQQYRAAYQKELKDLPTLLTTAQPGGQG